MDDEMILLEKIEKGLAQSEMGNVISDENLDKEIAKWFDWIGQDIIQTENLSLKILNLISNIL